MNILLLSEVSAERVIGGAERMLRGHVLSLGERGHRVSLISRAPVGDRRTVVWIKDAVERRYEVSRRNEPAFVWSSIRNGLRAFDLMTSLRRPDVAVVYQSLAGLGPLLGRFGQAGGWVYMCLSLAHEEYLTRIPPATSWADRLRQAANAQARLWIERMVMRRCQAVIVMSEFMRRRVMAVHSIQSDKIKMLPGAADLSRFRPAEHRTDVRHELKVPPTQTILFTVRNLVPRMGLENLIKAISLLSDEERRDLLLLIGGEGPLRASLDALIRRLRLAEHVRLLGFVPEEQLSRYYQAADLVVMPTWQLEGFGLVTVEALACGTPVLGTPVGALPEVLSRVDPMLIAEGTDDRALAAAIRRVLQRFRENPDEPARLSSKGRELIVRAYNWTTHAAELERMLRDVCAAAGRAR
ncbi:MAG TPA: glycosyltransferase family 4 protein [Nitrospiraceae bacterium]|jgi:glycosyltransferase involved in cell wall biosynthesis|nr:glycosyltransferase family 4 protein [Nitrospiraceae bacterium]